MSAKNRLTAAITMGDPAGIGAEVTLKALSDPQIKRLANFLIIGDAVGLAQVKRICKLRLKINKIKSSKQLAQPVLSGITLLDLAQISRLVWGRPLKSYGLASLEYIKVALKLIKSKQADLLVTAPVNKHTINRNVIPFCGHTEYLARASGAKHFAMMLASQRLKVVLVTRHLALKNVARSLTKQKIYQAIRLTAWGLKKYFAVAQPRIAVCGLNPHSGDQGSLGREEITLIHPAVRQAQRLAKVTGPIPADTLFYSALKGKFDAVVAMYHDQGLIPLKMLALHSAVNLTLGLPFIRTSPDHGTAYDIAGKNQADPGSMKEAIKLAVKIVSKTN